MKFIKALIILVLVPLLFASCELRSIPALIKGDKVRVKGVTLEHSRTITLTDNEKYDTFTVEASSGDIALEGGQSYSLEVKIWEKNENDVTLSIRKGKLVGETDSGNPYAIASVKGIIPINTSIDIETGAGNIMIIDVEGKDFEVQTGAGNMDFDNCNFPTMNFSTGAGNIVVTNIKTDSIEMDTGAGNILIKSLTAVELDCNTGVGNIDVFNSTASEADCNSGIGNISISESHFERHELDTGIGKINYKNNGKSVEL